MIDFPLQRQKSFDRAGRRTIPTLLFTALNVTLLLLSSCSRSSSKSSANEQNNSATKTAVERPNPPQVETEGLIPPEIVRAEEMRIVSGSKILTVGNSQGHYHLSCKAKLDSCVTPAPGKDYLLFTKSTRWKMPGATDCCATLKFFQDFSISYNDQENIALVPDDGPFGIYVLESWSKAH
jgi:hypothetical protein